MIGQISGLDMIVSPPFKRAEITDIAEFPGNQGTLIGGLDRLIEILPIQFLPIRDRREHLACVIMLLHHDAQQVNRLRPHIRDQTSAAWAARRRDVDKDHALPGPDETQKKQLQINPPYKEKQTLQQQVYDHLVFLQPP